MKLKLFGLAVLATALLLSGCAKEVEVDDGGSGTVTGGEDVTVTMTLNIPGAGATRGLSTTQEEAVNNVDIFMFDKNLRLTDWQYGELASNGSSFSATLKASKDNNDKFRLMVLANVRQTTYGIFQGTNFGGHKGKTYAEVRALLEASLPTYANLSSRGVPMWGEVEDMVLLTGTGNSYNMDLLRSLARIDVGMNANPQFGSNGQITGWAKLGNFSLEKVFVYNAGTHYSLATDRDNYDFTDKRVATYSLPPTTAKSSAKEYSDTQAAGTVTRDGTTGISVTGNIYVGESNIKMTTSGSYADANHANRMALVVAGYYNGSTDLSYYRLDFLEGTGSTLMDVLRNNCYQIIISNASGAGSPTPDEAFTKFNADLKVIVNRWSDAGQEGTTVNGDWWLKVAPYTFEFDKWAKTAEEITVTTNVALTAGKSWSATVEKYNAGDSDPTWLTIVSGTESGVTGDVLKFNVAQVPSGFLETDSRKAKLRFRAGTSPNDIMFDLVVTQTGDDGVHMLRLSHSEFVFAGRKWDALANGGAGGWTDPDPQEIAVNWGPTLWPYYLHLSEYTGGGVDMAVAFPANHNMPSLAISPAAIADTDPNVAANPFFERSSRLSFTVYDEGFTTATAITKQILIRQIYYSLVLSGTKDYYYQGNTYPLTVRSNCSWTAMISDPLSILENITGISGNGSTAAAGEKFTFKIKDNAAIDGRATVTFTSNDNLFPPKTITIIAQDVLANCEVIAPGGGAILQVRKAYRVWELDRDLYNDDGRTLPTGSEEAVLLWQDAQNLIGNITLVGSGRNAQIMVTTKNSTTKGNAVVAYKIDGEIYWSWHIWVTPDDPDLPANQGSANGYTFMDRNLGAFGTSGYDGFGLYYQGGRKDPFPRAAAMTGTTPRTIYNINNDVIVYNQTGGIVSVSAPATGGLPVSVKEPMSRLTGTYGNSHWYGLLEDKMRIDLWENGKYKSDLDPCPYGWKIVTETSLSGIISSLTSSPTSYYYTWNGMTWPAQGYFNYVNTTYTIASNGTNFYLMNARANTFPGTMQILGTAANSNNYRMSWLGAARCIKDE